MKKINLDKLKTRTPVELDGVEYTVRAVTVEEFVNDEFNIPEDATAEERTKAMIQAIHKLSGIPVDVLMKQEFGVLNAIMAISQGQEVDDGEVVETEKK